MPSTNLNLYVLSPKALREMKQYNIDEEDIADAVIAITGKAPHLGCSAGGPGLFQHGNLGLTLAYDPNKQPHYTVLGCFKRK